MATRKAPAKKAVAKKSAAPTNSREAVAERDDKVMGEIVNPNGSNGSTARTTKAPAKAKATAKKAPVKRGAAKKAVASSGQKHPLQGLTKAELTERLVGKEVELGKVTGESRWVKVDAIKTVNDNTITVQSNGKVERLQILDMAKARAIA
jgi:monomeric isocitrate dehydrogenase